MGITHIVSVVQDVLPPLPQGLRWIERMQIAVEDMPFAELVGHLPGATRWIEEALATGNNGRRPAKVLVHCHEGVSRSVSVVIAYLMMKYRWHPDQALEYIRTKREIANPNFGFKRQLAEYATAHLGMKNVRMPTS
jgi:protein-tyrosine phosphatase